MGYHFPCVLKEDATGVILCIPTAFCSFTGEALDKKDSAASFDGSNFPAGDANRSSVQQNTTATKVTRLSARSRSIS